MNELLLALIPSVISGLVAIAVCIMTNNYSRRIEQQKIEEKQKEYINSIQANFSNALSEISAKLEEVIANQELHDTELRKDLDHLTFCMTELNNKVEKHNHVIERTYHLETEVALINQKLSEV